MNGSLLLPWLFFFLFACGNSGSGDAGTLDGVTTFILVRHAEKGPGEDPDLTPEGRARAARLRDRLAREEVSRVYTTDTQRTRQTAAPTADQQGVEVTLYSPDALEAFASSLKEQHDGKTVLIVGHSNTTPILANLLAGGEEFAAISDDDYGNILVVTVPPTGTSRTQHLRY